MAARIRNVLASQRNNDLLWSHLPPCFLAPALRSSFSTSRPTAKSGQLLKNKRRHPHDAYLLRQAQIRKDANLGRQALLRERARKELGDPIRGVETDFVRSFDDGLVQNRSEDLENSNVSLDSLKARPDEPPPLPVEGAQEMHLDHGIDASELQEALRSSAEITEPISSSKDIMEDQAEAVTGRKLKTWESRNKNASEAVQRIVSLINGSSKHRTKKNIERVISRLGRHTTDGVLKPKAAAKDTKTDHHTSTPVDRAGPDTGSSEVQIGILTAKIRVLADRYEGDARKDKVNKRNLRLLLHRRQKMLKYMERTERGSERWTHMLRTLGLTPATWRGEITVK